MTEPVELRTERLLLRPWRSDDREAFAAMSADPRVMAFFPSTLAREESDALADRIDQALDTRGFGFWAVEIADVAPFAGFIGLSVPRFEAPFMPCFEIGWRLAAAHWNKGYATEGARRALEFGFETLKLDEVVALAVTSNVRSRRVMEKLGMTYDPADDFDHPQYPDDHPLRRHVLYRIKHVRGWEAESHNRPRAI